jgi:hypothetical protein
MSDRYTINDANKAFFRLATVLNKSTQAYKMGINGRPPGQYSAVVGAWELDYNPVYGGCKVVEISNPEGGQGEPFGPVRHSPRQFCAIVNQIIRAIEIYRATHETT